MQPHSDLAVEASGLGKTFGETRAVDGVDLAVGAETLVRALLDALGPDGALIAYTGWQDEPPDDLAALDEESRQIYREERPGYDPRVALSHREHGRVPEALRTWPKARHSGHPEASVAAVGPLADALTGGYRL